MIGLYSVKINPNEYFSYDDFFGNEIVDHVAWKCHCAITKKNVFEFRVISTIYDGLSNDYRCKLLFIYHLLRLMMSFSFKKTTTFRHNGSAIFGEMCRSVSLVARMVKHHGSICINHNF